MTDSIQQKLQRLFWRGLVFILILLIVVQFSIGWWLNYQVGGYFNTLNQQDGVSAAWDGDLGGFFSRSGEWHLTGKDALGIERKLTGHIDYSWFFAEVTFDVKAALDEQELAQLHGEVDGTAKTVDAQLTVAQWLDKQGAISIQPTTASLKGNYLGSLTFVLQSKGAKFLAQNQSINFSGLVIQGQFEPLLNFVKLPYLVVNADHVELQNQTTHWSLQQLRFDLLTRKNDPNFLSISPSLRIEQIDWQNQDEQPQQLDQFQSGFSLSGLYRNALSDYLVALFDPEASTDAMVRRADHVLQYPLSIKNIQTQGLLNRMPLYLKADIQIRPFSLSQLALLMYQKRAAQLLSGEGRLSIQHIDRQLLPPWLGLWYDFGIQQGWVKVTNSQAQATIRCQNGVCK